MIALLLDDIKARLEQGGYLVRDKQNAYFRLFPGADIIDQWQFDRLRQNGFLKRVQVTTGRAGMPPVRWVKK